jgi:hypothetical protein
MAVTRIGIQEELTDLFPGIALDPLYIGMVEVGYVLGRGMANGQFVTGLQALETALQAALERRLTSWRPFAPRPNMVAARGAAVDYWQQHVAGNMAKDETYSHLLSEELTRIERQAGFSFNNRFGSPRKAQLYVSVVSPQNFRAQLAEGRHWKDPGVPGAHGEFTHRIQWYVIVRSGALPAGVPVRVFKSTADRVRALDPPRNGATEVDLWQALCDRDLFNGGNTLAVRADSAADFRCPEHFSAYLVNQLDEGTYPLLRGFLAARFQKRGGWDAQDYVAKKLYRRPYAQLTEDEQFRVIGAMGNRDLLAGMRYGMSYGDLEPQQRQWVDARMGRAILRA